MFVKRAALGRPLKCEDIRLPSPGNPFGQSVISLGKQPLVESALDLADPGEVEIMKYVRIDAGPIVDWHGANFPPVSELDPSPL